MKKKIITIIALFCSFSCFSQNRIDEIDGTWMYQNNDIIFKIKLVKGITNYKDGKSGEAFFGGYYLKVNGKVTENYIDNISTTWDVAKVVKPTQINISIIIAYNNWSTTEGSINFYDRRKKHFNGDGIWGGRVEILPSGKLHWKLDEKLGIWARTEGCEDCPPVEPVGFSVPEDVILTKIE